MKVRMCVGMVTHAFEAASDEQLEEMLRTAYDHISALYELAYPDSVKGSVVTMSLPSKGSVVTMSLPSK